MFFSFFLSHQFWRVHQLLRIPGRDSLSCESGFNFTWDPFTLACPSSESFHLGKGRLISCGCSFFWLQLFLWTVRFLLLFTLTSKPDTSLCFPLTTVDELIIRDRIHRDGRASLGHHHLRSSYLRSSILNLLRRRAANHDLQFLCFSSNYPTNPISFSVSFKRS